MRYFKRDGIEYVENGRCKIKVGTIDHTPSPKSPGRILKIVVVNDVIQQNVENPIFPDQALALSFPESQVNNKDYVWHMDGPEECLVPLTLKLT